MANTEETTTANTKETITRKTKENSDNGNLTRLEREAKRGEMQGLSDEEMLDRFDA